ncbi:phenylalanine--tRNA ligase subunit alpha [Candidatus Uhrbacteria bacterium]|nr:phenylalanine--tRNA ligase subunit alpha [Candidatus Uhrbacteria bacterium]
MNTQTLQTLAQQFRADLTTVTSADELRELEIRYLGRKQGLVTELLRKLKDLSIEQRKKIGPQIQQLKVEITAEIENTESQILNFRSQISVDVTLPGEKIPVGHYCPLTTIRRQAEDVFRSMGFMVIDGPELESEYYNFEAVNIPAWHPAREMWDTFYVRDPERDKEMKRQGDEESNRLLLRTHTSAMQVRIMREFPLPIKAIVPGTVYRNEATDARHEKAFLNVEGLLVGKGISLQHLISVNRVFLKKVLGDDVQVRFRPGYFPFTEPSLELDISCLICKQTGCSVCKKTGWLEYMGAGMVHPNVLRAGGIDPKKYTGFAFGFGLDRLVMLKYGVDDVRLFRSQDLRFIQQF